MSWRSTIGVWHCTGARQVFAIKGCWSPLSRGPANTTPTLVLPASSKWPPSTQRELSKTIPLSMVTSELVLWSVSSFSSSTASTSRPAKPTLHRPSWGWPRGRSMRLATLPGSGQAAGGTIAKNARRDPSLFFVTRKRIHRQHVSQLCELWVGGDQPCAALQG